MAQDTSIAESYLIQGYVCAPRCIWRLPSRLKTGLSGTVSPKCATGCGPATGQVAEKGIGAMGDTQRGMRHGEDGRSGGPGLPPASALISERCWGSGRDGASWHASLLLVGCPAPGSGGQNSAGQSSGVSHSPRRGTENWATLDRRPIGMGSRETDTCDRHLHQLCIYGARPP